ncbi:MAG: 4a-hydroxytetrahydrobiopterin dehydratase [bacterium]|nr:4a-hydroxytetrahydrobiopterin dehydratase [bacterium]
MGSLAQQKCVPCEGGTPPLESARAEELKQQINVSWELVMPRADQSMRIKRNFKFKDFKQAIAFVNRVAEIAEAEGHHPDLHIFYNKVTIELWTHAVMGLSENDFIVAAKIDQIV